MEKTGFVVAPSVTLVNGVRVVDGQRLEMTEREAEYDLGLARISREPLVSARSAPKRKADTDGGD